MTLQSKIFLETEYITKREFAKRLKLTEGYIANMLNSDKSISLDLGVLWMEKLEFDRQRIKDIIIEFLG